MHRESMHERMRRHHQSHRRRECGPGGHRGRPSGLLRRIVIRFGLSILIIMFVVGAFVHGGSTDKPVTSLQQVVAHQLSSAWQTEDRQALTRQLAEQMQAKVTVRGVDGELLLVGGGECKERRSASPLSVSGERIGSVTVCGFPRPSRKRFFLGIALAALALFGATGFIARRVLWPLGEVARVARDIGEGDLTSRVSIAGRNDEVGELATAINDMASRIQKQLIDQKELLAAVSHEMRTPLAHMRVMTELAREGDDKLDEIDQEIESVDRLVGQLLANSRLEFEVIDFHPVNLALTCATALERAGLDASLLHVETDEVEVQGDPMLLAHAIANLVGNAQAHADSLQELRVVREGHYLTIEARDRGPGFAEEDLDKVFTAFFQGKKNTQSHGGNLGLGLSLVQKIANAHGGDAFAHNTQEGAIVGIRVRSPG